MASVVEFLMAAPMLGKRSSKAYLSWFAVRNSKKSPNQETGLGNRGPLEALNDIKLILND